MKSEPLSRIAEDAWKADLASDERLEPALIFTADLWNGWSQSPSFRGVATLGRFSDWPPSDQRCEAVACKGTPRGRPSVYGRSAHAACLWRGEYQPAANSR